jgi:epoxyqueuosine reductase
MKIMNTQFKSQIIDKAMDLGFGAIGFAKPTELIEETEYIKFSSEKGYTADNKYLLQNIELLCNPNLLVPNAKTIIVTAYNYYTEFHHNQTIGNGRISRYGWGDDYHNIIKSQTELLAEYIKEIAPEANNFCSADGGKVLEKRWAQYAGIAWQGKHSIAINKQYGSWIFLSVIITDLELEPDEVHKDLCGNCTICIDNCPTHAIIGDRKIDARKCITHITIEDKKKEYELNQGEENQYIYGCDLCQNVCPWNKTPIPTNDKRFEPRFGQTELNFVEINAMNEEQFNSRFDSSPIKRIKLKALQENIKYVNKFS